MKIVVIGHVDEVSMRQTDGIGEDLVMVPSRRHAYTHHHGDLSSPSLVFNKGQWYGPRKGQCMCLVSGVRHHKFGCFVNGHDIHAALHRAKQVMVKMGNVDGLVYQQKERPPS